MTWKNPSDADEDINFRVQKSQRQGESDPVSGPGKGSAKFKIDSHRPTGSGSLFLRIPCSLVDERYIRASDAFWVVTDIEISETHGRQVANAQGVELSVLDRFRHK